MLNILKFKGVHTPLPCFECNFSLHVFGNLIIAQMRREATRGKVRANLLLTLAKVACFSAKDPPSTDFSVLLPPPQTSLPLSLSSISDQESKIWHRLDSTAGTTQHSRMCLTDSTLKISVE